MTTFRGLETEPGNLNFVFSTLSAIEEQWDYYYRTVPMLLGYMVSVADCVVGRFVEWDQDKRLVQQLLRDLAFLRYSEETSSDVQSTLSLDGILETLDSMFELVCEGCGRPIRFDRVNADRLWSAAELECIQCGKIHDFWGATFVEDG